MKLNLAIALLFILVCSAVGQLTPKSKIILGEWHSTNSYHKAPIRKLIFKVDSSFEETANGSLGSITSLSKYYFVGDQIVIVNAAKNDSGRIVFYNNNKFKFTEFSDSSTDYMYKLTFKRIK
jgi:hypothetical protein